ncbi:hypothetical protein PC128_g12108 [Phytophthora cactorum]|nr:hypothetical protein PC128_g12108 [Phytophthora cactorum]
MFAETRGEALFVCASKAITPGDPMAAVASDYQRN